MKQKVLLGMSGGVDSSAAACILKEKGFEVAGVTFRLWDWIYGIPNSDISDAKDVCRQLNIPHFTADLREEFKLRVIDKFVAEYLEGKTPNPCVYCNKYIKFQSFIDIANKLGYDFISTGHYAKKNYNKELCRHELLRCTHAEKDQSYVLYSITQEQLARMLFPLADYTKQEIREVAKRYGLEIAQKPDSQDICFIPNGKHTAFIEEYTGKKSKAGNFVDQNLNILGRNRGIDAYTIGQRKGLGVSFGKPMYVSAILPNTGDVILVDNEKDLYKSTILAHDINWVSSKPLLDSFQAEVQIRYSHKATLATIEPMRNGEKVKITFDREQRAPTKGQAVVAYINDRVICGGIID